MRKAHGVAPFYSEDFAATNSAPSGADGASCKLDTVGGDVHVADEWTVVCKFTGTGTTATITPYEKIGGTWVGGTTQNVKKVPDTDGGAILDLAGHGCATDLDFHVSALDADGVTIEVWHNEHSEVL
jgi:hypothetical protein